MTTHVQDFAELSERCRESGHGFGQFARDDRVSALGWPQDVVEQLLYEHADNVHFERDYGTVDLNRVRWRVEGVQVHDLLGMPTGPSDERYLQQVEADPHYYLGCRDSGVHRGAALMWETHGTWKRWPLLIDQSLLVGQPGTLQVVEGRTRVGVLRGRHRLDEYVATAHLAWVGRPVAG